MTLAVGDPGMMSVRAYVDELLDSEQSIDPIHLWKRLLDKYEEVAHTTVFAPESRDGVEQDVFSTIVDRFLPYYRRITDVDVIVADFGAEVSRRRNKFVHSILTRFFSQLAATAKAVQGDERLAAQFTPAFRASLANLNLALRNGEFFEGDFLDDLLRIERLFFNTNIKLMGQGIISMIEWDTASGKSKPVYPAGFEGMFGQIIDINPSVWRRALRAVLVAMEIHEGLKLDDRLAELDVAHQEIELFTFARQSELSHVEGKAIVIPVDDQDELHEMEVRFMDYLSLNGSLPNVEDMLDNAAKDARDRSLLLLLDEGLVGDAKHLLALRQETDALGILGLLIHAAAAHGQLTGLRRTLFDAALRAIIAKGTRSGSMKPSTLEVHAGIGPYGFDGQRIDEKIDALYHLIPLLDFSEEEQAMQDVITDINVYLTNYYQRKPHTKTSSGGPTSSSPSSGTPSRSTAGGARFRAHHEDARAITRRRGARGLPHRARRIAHAFVRGARMAARV